MVWFALGDRFGPCRRALLLTSSSFCPVLACLCVTISNSAAAPSQPPPESGLMLSAHHHKPNTIYFIISVPKLTAVSLVSYRISNSKHRDNHFLNKLDHIFCKHG